jgi:phosphate/sulfate permease
LFNILFGWVGTPIVAFLIAAGLFFLLG